jgi:hypothetical protein
VALGLLRVGSGSLSYDHGISDLRSDHRGNCHYHLHYYRFRVEGFREMVVVVFPAITVSVICGRITGETTTTISITTVLGFRVLGLWILGFEF